MHAELTRAACSWGTATPLRVNTVDLMPPAAREKKEDKKLSG